MNLKPSFALIAIVLIPAAGGALSCADSHGESGKRRRDDNQANDDRAADQWQYTRKVVAPGTRSERVEGVLLRNGSPVLGQLGQIIDTPKGRFMYFGKQDRANNKGWLNKTTSNSSVFNPDGSLAKEGAEFWKSLRDAVQLKLHKPAGEAPALLREVDEWVMREEMSFDTGETVSYLTFKKNEVVTKVAKRFEDAMRNKSYPAEHHVLQASSSVLLVGEQYFTYQLDTDNKVLLLRVLVPVGKNQWTYLSGRLGDNTTEMLFQFDRDPLTAKEGQVTITRPGHVREKITAPFRVQHFPRGSNHDYESWFIHVQGGPHNEYRMSYQRYTTGLTIFQPQGTWKPDIYKPGKDHVPESKSAPGEDADAEKPGVDARSRDQSDATVADRQAPTSNLKPNARTETKEQENVQPFFIEEMVITCKPKVRIIEIPIYGGLNSRIPVPIRPDAVALKKAYWVELNLDDGKQKISLIRPDVEQWKTFFDPEKDYVFSLARFRSKSESNGLWQFIKTVELDGKVVYEDSNFETMKKAWMDKNPKVGMCQ